MAHHGAVGKFAQLFFQRVIRLLAFIEKPDGQLPLLGRQGQSRHQGLGRRDLRLGHTPIRLVDVSQGGEQRSEEKLARIPGAGQPGDKTVEKMTHHAANDGAEDTATKKPKGRADDLAPAYFGYAATAWCHEVERAWSVRVRRCRAQVYNCHFGAHKTPR